MAKCENCGQTINREEVRDYCDMTKLNYDEVSKDLCAECLESAKDNHDEGVIFDICEKCGNRFDVCEDEVKVEYEAEQRYGLCDMDLMDIWNNDGRILCADCALDDYVSELRYKIDNENKE